MSAKHREIIVDTYVEWWQISQAMYDIARLYEEMLNQGFTVNSLARRARMPESTLRGIFKDRTGHPDNIRRVAEALGFTLRQIRKLPETETVTTSARRKRA